MVIVTVPELTLVTVRRWFASFCFRIFNFPEISSANGENFAEFLGFQYFVKNVLAIHTSTGSLSDAGSKPKIKKKISKF